MNDQKNKQDPSVEERSFVPMPAETPSQSEEPQKQSTEEPKEQPSPQSPKK